MPHDYGSIQDRTEDAARIAYLEAEVARLQRHIEELAPKPHWPTAVKSLVSRLRGIYAIGPQADQNIAEFGFKHYPDRPPIQYEAAARISDLTDENERLTRERDEAREAAQYAIKHVTTGEISQRPEAEARDWANRFPHAYQLLSRSVGKWSTVEPSSPPDNALLSDVDSSQVRKTAEEKQS